MKKVYCGKCRHYIYCDMGEICNIPGKFKDIYRERIAINYDPLIKNKNNDCKDYEPKWYVKLMGG